MNHNIMSIIGHNKYIVNFSKWKRTVSRAMDRLWMTYENCKVSRLSRWIGRQLHGKPGVYVWKRPQVHVGAMAFDLPAGHTCPGADICQSEVDRVTGLLSIGPKCKIRCFQASIETFSTSARDLRWHNFRMLRAQMRWSMYSNRVYNMFALLNKSVPEWVRVVRVHSSGDFFTPAYVQAWIDLAKSRPRQIFFGYTKTLYAWNAIRVADLPNFRMTWSLGSVDDKFIPMEASTAEIVLAPREDTICLDHDRDWDDFLAIMAQKKFSLVVHGTQAPELNALISALEMEW